MSMRMLEMTPSQGLFEVLESGLQGLGIQEVSAEQCKNLVSIGIGGTSANIRVHRLKVWSKSNCPGCFGCGVWLIDWS